LFVITWRWQGTLC